MIALLPQHGRSNRLPGKAMRDFCGLPLVAWSVIQAMAAHCIDEVYVSTESQEIADICEPHGAKIIWRPKWLTEKRYAANEPFQHMIGELGLGGANEAALFLLATSPLRKPADIDRLYEGHLLSPPPPRGLMKQIQLGCDTQEACIYKQHPPYNGVKRGRMVHGDKSHKTMIPFGGMNISDTREYLETQPRLHWILDDDHVTDAAADQDLSFYSAVNGSGIFYYVDCELWQTNEIDDVEGFRVCEALMESQILKGRGKEIYDEYARS